MPRPDGETRTRGAHNNLYATILNLIEVKKKMVFAKPPWNRRVIRYGNLKSANARYGSTTDIVFLI
jgi:hypothetical protein